MLYDVTILQFTKMLTNLSQMLETASSHAATRKFAPEVLLESRLAPDQFHCMRQIQITTDTAKLAAARLTGKPAPVHEDNEKTIVELQARIESVVAYLKTFTRDDFAGAEERRVTQPRWEGKSLSGKEFAEQHAIPNFYFHLTTAYAILRHNGVDIGKKSYLGAMPYQSA